MQPFPDLFILCILQWNEQGLQSKHRWFDHVLRHNRLLHPIIVGRMKGKPTRGRRRIQMLHDLANDDGYVALKQATEDREGWRHRERMSKPVL